MSREILVLVELGINDLVEVDGFQGYERLIRGVLELETRPAILCLLIDGAVPLPELFEILNTQSRCLA